MREINEEDIEFLRNLQHEMNTQDTVGQADPRFWVVMETVRQWGYDSDYADDCCICDSEGNEYRGETLEEMLKQFIENDDYDISYTVGDFWVEIDGYDSEIMTFEDICEYMNATFGKDNLSVCYYKDVERIVPNTMFLTKRECEEHIKRNHYHYNKPHSYAMTAWRSPQVKKLYEILQNVDWTILNDDTNAYEALPRDKRVVATLEGKLVVAKRKKRGIKLDEEVE